MLKSSRNLMKLSWLGIIITLLFFLINNAQTGEAAQVIMGVSIIIKQMDQSMCKLLPKYKDQLIQTVLKSKKKIIIRSCYYNRNENFIERGPPINKYQLAF
ncbi:MAG: hypothetical protein ACOX4L_00835 [Bacillota bacterium]|jgi:hypothetical protein